MSSKTDWYPVWKVRFNINEAMRDPDVPDTRYHTALFVEVEPGGTGILYHVTGDIIGGMRFRKDEFQWPEKSQKCNSMELMGCTPKTGHRSAWEALLRTLPPPHKQKAFNPQTGKAEQVKSWVPLTFYSPGEYRPPLVRCTEWTEQQAIPSLQSAGLLVQTSGGTSTSAAAAVQ
jgi:hypothetical protein